MDENKRQYKSYYATQLSRGRPGLQFKSWRQEDRYASSKKDQDREKSIKQSWTVAQLQANSGRGTVPGVVDPAKDRGSTKWVSYPDDHTNPSDAREANLVSQRAKHLREVVAKRQVQILAQRCVAQQPLATQVPTRPRAKRRTAAEREADRSTKRPRGVQSGEPAATEDGGGARRFGVSQGSKVSLVRTAVPWCVLSDHVVNACGGVIHVPVLSYQWLV